MAEGIARDAVAIGEDAAALGTKCKPLGKHLVALEIAGMHLRGDGRHGAEVASLHRTPAVGYRKAGPGHDVFRSFSPAVLLRPRRRLASANAPPPVDRGPDRRSVPISTLAGMERREAPGAARRHPLAGIDGPRRASTGFSGCPESPLAGRAGPMTLDPAPPGAPPHIDRQGFRLTQPRKRRSPISGRRFRPARGPAAS